MNSVMQKLGFPKRVNRVTKKMCLDRIRILKKGLKEEKYKGQRRELAQYYVYRYTWMAKSL